MDSRTCPTCQSELSPDQASCPRCGAADAPAAAPQGAAEAVPDAPAAADEKLVPAVVGEIDPVKHALTSFEAYLVSMVDGVSDVETLGQVVGMQTVEVLTMLRSLEDRGVVTLAAAAAPAPPPPQKAVLGRMSTTKMPAFRVKQAAKKPKYDVPPLEQAIALEYKGDLPAAIKVLQDALEFADEPAPLYNRLALMVVKQSKDFKKAESLLRKAVELAPKRDLYQRNLAKVLELSAKPPPRRP